MAKKSKTPPPPRRVQAPRVRHDQRGADDRRKWTIIGIAALGFVGAAIAVGIFAFGGGGSTEAEATVIRNAGCTLNENVPIRYPAGDARARHYEKLPSGYKYPSFPPAGGPHHPVPAPFDVYDDPVDQSRLVHNLEHGGVTIQYGGDVPQTTVDEVVDWYRQAPNGIVIAPLPALGNMIALAAWDASLSAGGDVTSEHSVLAKCRTFDEAAFDAFMDAYAFQGPERFAQEDLAPGR